MLFAFCCCWVNSRASIPKMPFSRHNWMAQFINITVDVLCIVSLFCVFSWTFKSLLLKPLTAALIHLKKKKQKICRTHINIEEHCLSLEYPHCCWSREIFLWLDKKSAIGGTCSRGSQADIHTYICELTPWMLLWSDVGTSFIWCTSFKMLWAVSVTGMHTDWLQQAYSSLFVWSYTSTYTA